MSSSSSSKAADVDPSPYLSNIQSFVSEHKRTILIASAAAAVAAAGVAYFHYAATPQDDDEDDAEKGVAGDKKGKKKKSKGKKKRSSPKDGPILEELTKEEDAPSETESLPVLTEVEIQVMSTQERSAKAAALKGRGNTAYQQRQFQKAVDYYTQAIEVTPKPEAVFYSNRAACYVNFSPPKNDLVVADCDEALKIDPMYLKALNRRANALEALELYEGASRDFTALTILEKFQNQNVIQSVERVLNKLAATKAAETLKTRGPQLPSVTFVSAYLAAFRPRALPTLPEEPSTGDQTLLLAFQALEAGDYKHSLSLVNEALTPEQAISWDVGRAEALNLRGTFKFLIGDYPGAQSDFEQSLAILPSFTQTWVKIASVHVEQANTPAAFDAFEQAIKHNPDDPDIYYHRGQVHFILQEYTKAADDYEKSTSLDDQFVFSHIQLAVAQYKSENVANSMATFRRTLKAFPKRSEPLNYYGELLMDQQRFPDAVDKFDKAIELEREKPPPMNVLPLVNKGLALHQWKADITAATDLCREALSIDPGCEAAVSVLAELSVQQGRIDVAVEMFGKTAQLARTERELVNALTLEYSTRAQLEFMRNYPLMAEQLGQMARSLA